MEKQFTIFDFLGEALILFSITILFVTGSSYLFGKEAVGLSSLFQLERKGIALPTILQLLVFSILLEASKILWFSQRLFQALHSGIRMVGMLGSIVLLVFCYAVNFHWFPVDEVYAWVWFGGSLIICVSGTFVTLVVKKKLENKKLEEGMRRYRKERGLEDGEDH